MDCFFWEIFFVRVCEIDVILVIVVILSVIYVIKM